MVVLDGARSLPARGPFPVWACLCREQRLRAESNAGAITSGLAHICHGRAYRDNSVCTHMASKGVGVATSFRQKGAVSTTTAGAAGRRGGWGCGCKRVASEPKGMGNTKSARMPRLAAWGVCDWLVWLYITTYCLVLSSNYYGQTHANITHVYTNPIPCGPYI